jgi:hypothetical protein
VLLVNLCHFHTFRSRQAIAVLLVECKLVDAKASPEFSLLRAQHRRWRGAQNHTAAGSDPVPVPMPMQHNRARGIGLDRGQNVCSVDQRQAHAFVQADRRDPGTLRSGDEVR